MFFRNFGSKMNFEICSTNSNNGAQEINVIKNVETCEIKVEKHTMTIISKNKHGSINNTISCDKNSIVNIQLKIFGD